MRPSLKMTRPLLVPAALGLALLFVCPIGAQARQPDAQPGGHLTASLDGRAILLRDVRRFHCHDLAHPVYRCFTTPEGRDRDLLSVAAADQAPSSTTFGAPSGELAIQAFTYAIAYEHINFAGASLAISNPVSDLGPVGWGNRISSFKSTNGGRPMWWDGTGYTGTAWQWGTSYWVSNVGDGANDRFTSVQNVP